MRTDAGRDEIPTAPRLTRMGEIRPGLWLGNLQSAAELTTFPSDIRWTVISVLKSEMLFSYVRTILREVADCVHVEWALDDSSRATFVSARLDEILLAMDEVAEHDDTASPRRRACLVHCAAGVSRSAAVCAAWLISRPKLTLAEALNEVKRVRPVASPKLGFIAGLRAIEQCNGNVEAARRRMEASRTKDEIAEEDAGTKTDLLET